MTLTTSDVQDVQTIVKTVLDAGTWTNYGSEPTIQMQNKPKRAKNTFINLNNSNSEPVLAANNAVIYFNMTCELEIYSRNRTDINALYTDIHNIFKAYTSRMVIITNERDVGLRGKYSKFLQLRVI